MKHNQKQHAMNLSLDLAIIANNVDGLMKAVDTMLERAAEDLLRQIEPDDKLANGAFMLHFNGDVENESVFWTSEIDTDASELRSIKINFLHTNRFRESPRLIIDLFFSGGNEDFNVEFDSLFIEAKHSLVNALLNRLNRQRMNKVKSRSKKRTSTKKRPAR